jgi:hypothetical protein
VKKIKIIALLFVSLFVISDVSAHMAGNLFKIERNKNANVVMYDVRLDAIGDIDKNNPIDSYWILYAKQGQRKKIAAFEKRAYGFEILYNSGGYYDLTLKAVPNKVIKVYMVNGVPKAEIKINNKEAYLSTVYVFANDNLIPKVLYYTLTGIDIRTGVQVKEKIIVK